MITEELNQEQLNLELTNQELQKEFEEVSSAMKDLETEIEALRKLYNDKSQVQIMLEFRMCCFLGILKT